MEFDEWFDIFIDSCDRLGYTGNVDKWSFEDDYISGEYPEDVAKEFVDEMNEE